MKPTVGIPQQIQETLRVEVNFKRQLKITGPITLKVQFRYRDPSVNQNPLIEISFNLNKGEKALSIQKLPTTNYAPESMIAGYTYKDLVAYARNECLSFVTNRLVKKQLGLTAWENLKHLIEEKKEELIKGMLNSPERKDQEIELKILVHLINQKIEVNTGMLAEPILDPQYLANGDEPIHLFVYISNTMNLLPFGFQIIKTSLHLKIYYHFQQETLKVICKLPKENDEKEIESTDLMNLLRMLTLHTWQC